MITATPLSKLTPRKPTYLIPKFIEEGQHNLLFGSGGCGKSYLSAHISMSLASGSDFLNETPTKKCRVLYLDFECNSDTFAYRCQSLEVSLNQWDNSAKDDVLYCQSTKSLASIIVEVKKIVEDNGIGLVVIDSAAYACGGQAKDEEATMAYFSALNTLGITTLTVAHETKAKAHDNAYGSVFFMASVRNAFNVTRERDTGSSAVKLILAHRKGNNSALVDDITAIMSFGEDAVSVIRFGEPRKSVKVSICDALSNGNSLTAKDLSSVTGYSLETVKTTLSRLKSDGVVVNFSVNWTLKS